jgi:hypothetical protein
LRARRSNVGCVLGPGRATPSEDDARARKAGVTRFFPFCAREGKENRVDAVNPPLPVVKTRLWLPGPLRLQAPERCKKMLDLNPGTGSSNPFLSSGESANHRSLSGGNEGAEALQLHHLYRTMAWLGERWPIRPEPASWRRAAARMSWKGGPCEIDPASRRVASETGSKADTMPTTRPLLALFSIYIEAISPTSSVLRSFTRSLTTAIVTPPV